MEQNRSIADEFLEKATALKSIEEALGEFYDEQKNALLNEFLAASLPMTQAIAILKSFLSAGLITPKELSTLTSQVLALGKKGNEAKPAAPLVVPESKAEVPKAEAPKADEPVERWNGVEMRASTDLKDIAVSLAEKVNEKKEVIDELIAVLRNLEVYNVKQALDMETKDRQFSFLDDMIQLDQKALFYKIAATLKGLAFAKAELDKQNEVVIANKSALKEQAIKEEDRALLESSFHLWGKDAQLLILPLDRQIHYFCYYDMKEDEASIMKKGEHLIYCLDISASMNHDSKGVYVAPGSDDHPDSSIKKARALIVPLCMAALKRQASVSVYPWNYKVSAPIEFTADQYIDKASGEFIDDKEIEKDIRERTSEKAFVAKGGTNIEAALQAISARVQKLATTVSNVAVWFVTDGEETVYQKAGTPERIPSNQHDGLFGFFNKTTDSGLTMYQHQMISEVDKLVLALADLRCSLEFHVCHLGEAHVGLLKKLADASSGHFHAVNDVANIEKEMAAQAVATGGSLTILGAEGKTYRFPAAVTDGALYSRGVLPADLFHNEIFVSRSATIQVLNGEAVKLTECEISPIPTQLKDNVTMILNFEPRLGEVLNSLKNDITINAINKASYIVKDLREERMNSIAAISKFVKAGTILQAFLEKVLDSVSNQMDGLMRLLSQYQHKEGVEYDKTSAKQQDMLTYKQKQAIEAGLDSMKVTLGKGFVSQSNLDKQIQKLMATHGPWARKMLNRVCLIAKTPRKENTLLTLIIVEGDQFKQARAKVLNDLGKDFIEIGNMLKEVTTVVDLKEKLEHNEKDEVISNFSISVKGKQGRLIKIDRKIAALDIYKPVASYTTCPNSEELDDAGTRMMDPLSFAPFLDLIHENNTLPAYLYSIGSNQSVGLLFNAKESLYVVSGGAESTSFDYFRLFWRLAKKDENNAVIVPGTFHKANTALPIAPEPLTNLVLSNLMPGLLSEFVTGSPMAPLTGVGLLYAGFVVFHMRQENISGVDVSRLAELLATIACWIDNPQTIPKVDEFKNLVGMLVKEEGIPPSESPGKHVPLKALVFSIIDTQFELREKYAALQKETLKRYVKQILVPKVGEEKVPEQLAKNQLVMRDFWKDVINDFSHNHDLIDDVPVAVVNAAEQLVKVAKCDISQPEVIEYVKEKRHADAILRTIRRVLIDVAGKAFPKYLHWGATQRLFYVFYAIAQYPFDKLKATFRAFESPEEFENAVRKRTDLLKNVKFDDVICSWMDGSEYYILSYLGYESLTLREFNSGKTENIDPARIGEYPQVCLQIWKTFRSMMDLYPGFWKASPHTCYGTHDLDYKVIAALKDPSLKLADTLSQGQLSEYYKAREGRDPAYKQYAVEKPKIQKLETEHYFVGRQDAKPITEKDRISVIFIGNVDAGKSTAAGNLIYNMGFINKRVIERYEKDCASIGKSSFKFAWILDTLRTERELGLTENTSSWNIETSKYEVDIIDAPGHRHFIKNMSVGSSFADAAILVVSASPGEFEQGLQNGGMTKEEAMVANANGVKQFIVLINKMDSVDYSEKRFLEIREEILRLLMRFGIDREKVAVIPTSAFNSENMIEPCDKMPWYQNWSIKRGDGFVTGKTVAEAINALEVPMRPIDKPLRIPILRVHKVGGVGTVAVGRIASGQLRRGQGVLIMPGGVSEDVPSIEIFHSDRKDARAGDMIGFKIRNVAVSALSRGMVACDPKDHPLKAVTRFTAQIVVSNAPNAVKVGWCPQFFCHTANFTGKIIKLLQKVDKRTKAVIEENPAEIRNGESGVVLVETMEPVVVEPFAEMPPLGRFILRISDYTVAVGVVKTIEEAEKPAKPAMKVGSKHLNKR
eukprot:TRINITY_DN270_c0_g1_i4.p1 TRINITY_DN270_c0_g1~~TRINITY_DN270_c0_g1_i4.p1  ORF type:complete len:1841 (+),score=636.84 TRINITY_DN270_c0_g1_i4:878-6400(+)